jgi:hypothetical protein
MAVPHGLAASTRNYSGGRPIGGQEVETMTQPIGSHSRECYLQCYEDPIGKAAKSLCKNADTVTTGFLCDEPTVVSNACRSPTSKLDALLCDDRKMAEAQNTLWSNVKTLVWTIVSVLAVKAP